MEEKRKRFIEKVREEYRKTKKSSIAVFLALRTLVIICAVLQIIRGEFNNAALCILTLILFTIPFFIRDKFSIKLPNTLEIIIYAFIFSAEILGEINNFYGIIPYWDTILHTLNGFLAAGVGFALIDLLNNNVEKMHLEPIYVALVAFCFSMTIGVLWEFFEYGADKFLGLDMQKDEIVQKVNTVNLDETNSNKVVKINNIEFTIIYSLDENGEIVQTLIENGYLDIGLNDTMEDLVVNFFGASIFCIFGYLYILNRDKYNFVHHFIPTKEKK